MCEKHDLYGFQNNENGAMAEYMKFTKEAINCKVPEDLPIEKAILVEPFACSLHAVERANIKFGDFVVLSGAGILGYGCDVYIEATGHPSSVEQGLHAIRKLGAFVEFSVFSDDVTEDWSIISDRKRTRFVMGSS